MSGRCFGEGDALYARYHDEEWGRPVLDVRGMYERLCLEAFQAGLSWRTVLYKRAAFRELFCEFDPERVAAFGRRDITRLLGDARIIRNRAKIEAAIANARATLELSDSGTSLVELVWRFAPTSPCARRIRTDVPAVTPESRALAGALRAAGYRFVGPTTAYATMQAAGLVNDHLLGCPQHRKVEAQRQAALRRLYARSESNSSVGLASHHPPVNHQRVAEDE